MRYENMTAEELVQHVWLDADQRTALELELAERLQHALDALEADFGRPD